jgi:hypothetical protein
MELLGVVTVSDRKSNSAGELVHSLGVAEVILRATSGGLVCGVAEGFGHLERWDCAGNWRFCARWDEDLER